MKKYCVAWKKIQCLLTMAALIVSHFPQGSAFASSDSFSESEVAVTTLASKDLPSVRIPENIGEIQQVFQGPKNQFVILVQDAHAIPEAQRSIQKIIKYFQNHHNISLIAVEGAASSLDFEIFKSFPDQELLKKVLEEYLKEGELPGTVAAGILSERGAHYQGIEEWNLYEKGLESYLKALGNESRLIRDLQRAEKRLDREKKRIYSKELFKIDQSLKRFNDNKMDWAQILKLLAAVKKPGKGTELGLLLEEIMREESGQDLMEKDARDIDANRFIREFEQYSQSVKEFLFRNEQEREMDAQHKALRLLQSLARLELSRNDWESLKNLMRINECVFCGGPASDRLKKRCPIQPKDKLEISQRTRSFQQGHSDSLYTAPFGGFEGQNPIAAINNNIMNNPAAILIKGLNEASQMYTREAPKRISAKRNKDFDKTSRRYVPIMPNKLADEPLRVKNKNHIFYDLKIYQDHLAFYQNAEKRELAFLKNWMKLSSRASLLVAGGFHTEGLAKRLQASGVSYLVVRPAIHNASEASRYRGHMRGQVSWKSYFEVENGRVNLYKAFVRGARDKLLRELKKYLGSSQENASPETLSATKKDGSAANFGGHASRLLKRWRDQIVLNLAKKNRLDQASQYTLFIDEVLYPSDVKRRKRKELELKRRTERFIHGLAKLERRNEVTESDIFKLLASASIPSAAVSPSIAVPSLSLPFSLVTDEPIDGLHVSRFSIRSEMRNQRNSVKRALEGIRMLKGLEEVPNYDRKKQELIQGLAQDMKAASEDLTNPVVNELFDALKGQDASEAKEALIGLAGQDHNFIDQAIQLAAKSEEYLEIRPMLLDLSLEVALSHLQARIQSLKFASKLLQFYAGERKDHKGRLISDIWKYKHMQLETVHDYIQLLFPLKELGNFFSYPPGTPDPVIPVLSDSDIAVFRSPDDPGPQLRANMLTSLKLMLDFYGFEFQYVDEEIIVKPSAAFRARQIWWLTQHNHNFLRITRILKSLVLVGMDSYALAFFHALKQLNQQHPSIVGHSFHFWQDAVKEIPPHTRLTVQEFQKDESSRSEFRMPAPKFPFEYLRELRRELDQFPAEIKDLKEGFQRAAELLEKRLNLKMNPKADKDLEYLVREIKASYSALTERMKMAWHLVHWAKMVLQTWEEGPYKEELEAAIRLDLFRSKIIQLTEDYSWLLQDYKKVTDLWDPPFDAAHSTPPSPKRRSEVRSGAELAAVSDSPDEIIPEAIEYLDGFYRLHEMGVPFQDETGEDEFDLRIPRDKDKDRASEVYWRDRLILSSDLGDFNAYETDTPVLVERNAEQGGLLGVNIALDKTGARFVRFQLAFKDKDNQTETVANPKKLILSPDGKPARASELILKVRIISREDLELIYPARSESRTKLQEALVNKGIDLSEFTEIIYPGSGNSDHYLMVSLAKVFPQIRKAHLISLSYQFRPGDLAMTVPSGVVPYRWEGEIANGISIADYDKWNNWRVSLVTEKDLERMLKISNGNIGNDFGRSEWQPNEKASKDLAEAAALTARILYRRVASRSEIRLAAGKTFRLLNRKTVAPEVFIQYLRQTRQPLSSASGETNYLNSAQYERAVNDLLVFLESLLKENPDPAFVLALDISKLSSELSAENDYLSAVREMRKHIKHLILQGNAKDPSGQKLMKSLKSLKIPYGQVGNSREMKLLEANQHVIPAINPGESFQYNNPFVWGVGLRLDKEIMDPRVRTYAVLLQFVFGVAAASKIKNPALLRMNVSGLQAALLKEMTFFGQHRDQIIRWTREGNSVISLSGIESFLQQYNSASRVQQAA